MTGPPAGGADTVATSTLRARSTCRPSFAEVNGRRIAYDEVSPPDPKGAVVLLTGLASKRLGWRSQMGPFGQIYRTIAMDHRDSGDSYMADAPYAVADQAVRRRCRASRRSRRCAGARRRHLDGRLHRAGANAAPPRGWWITWC